MADQSTKLLTCEEIGRLGGLTTAKRLTAEQRRESARRAARARWHKKSGGGDSPDPTDPKGPGRDHQGAEAGIMLSSRRPNVSASPDRSSGRGRAAAA